MFGEAPAPGSLAQGLPGDSESGGDSHVRIVFFSKLGNEGGHRSLSVMRPRGRVLVVGDNFVVQCGGVLCKRVVDAANKGQLPFSMPRAGGK